jgi:superfamily II DNA or RNA helicase
MKLWRTYFDAGSFARGLAQFRNRQVSELYVRDNGVEAVVEGDTGVYDVVIDWQQRVDTQFSGLVTDCTCPVGDFCKHAVAVLATMLDRELQKKSLLPVPEGWTKTPYLKPLPQVRPATKPKTPFEEPPTVVLLPSQISDPAMAWVHDLLAAVVAEPAQAPVVAVLTNAPEFGWQILPVRLRALKREGTWGVAKRYRSWKDFAHAHDDQLPASIAWISGIGECWYEDGQDADGILRLGSSYHFRQVIARGLVFMEPLAGGSLTLGETAAGALIWKKSAAGWQLCLQAEGVPADAQIMRLDQPWWISQTQRRVGEVALGFDDELLGRILGMPPLPLEVLPEVVARLRLSHAGIPAAPQELELARPVPVPVLRVWTGALTSTDWARRQQAQVLALVSFRYGDHELPAYGEVVNSVKRTRIVRQIGAEAARLQELLRTGLTCLEDLPQWSDEITSFPSSSIHVATQPLAAMAMARLRATGWEVSGTNVGNVPVSELGPVAAQLTDDGGWFDLALGTEIDGQRIDLVPLLTPLLRGGPAAWAELPNANGAVLVEHDGQRLLRVPLTLLHGLHAHLQALFARERGEAWRLNVWDSGVLAALDGCAVSVLGGERLRAIAAALLEPLLPAPTPPGLQAELRPYQSQGLAWLQRLRAVELGGILADDMGLGKTLQVIAHFCAEMAAGRLDRPCLVICPASMVGTWQRELTRFAPGLASQVLYGTNRETTALVAGVIGITTYGVLHRDIEQLAAIPLHIAVCDEAQVVKNAGTKAAQALRRLEARQRLCLTGTPLENHLGELHAQVTWTAAGVFGTRASFDTFFVKPIIQGDRERSELLRRRLQLVLLRRTKQQVATDLPPRSESVMMVELGARQRALYESIRLAMDARIREVIAAKGLARSGIEVIEALLRLRQVACDPALLKTPDGLACAESAKLETLAEMLPTMVEDGRRILIFSQFTSFLDRIEDVVLQPANLTWLRLDGQTRNRQVLVDRFQAKEVPIFLLSLKAGGTGLTLTAADTVILADPWWNPAVEAQAADRAHRIGQTQPVLVYRLVAAATIEEKVLALQARKRALADALYDETGQSLGSLTAEDLAALLAPIA